MDIVVGTSGFSYPSWRGSFYPEKLPATDMLRFYGTRFPTVEINNTFYRMPSPGTLSSWSSQVPPGFRVVLKAPRRITHLARLVDVEQPVAYFFNVSAALGDRRGPALFQLPPNLPKDTARLQRFLALVPPDVRVALEVRHPSWRDPEVTELLRQHGAALCLADTEEAPLDELPATASWGYLRLRRPDYTDRDLQAWCARLEAQPWEEAFVFFKHEEAGRGAQLATRLMELWAASRPPKRRRGG